MYGDNVQAEDTFKKEKFVLSVAQSPDGRWLASGSMDGTVAVFDAATRQLLHTLDGHFKPVRSLCFTPGACLANCLPLCGVCTCWRPDAGGRIDVLSVSDHLAAIWWCRAWQIQRCW